MLTAPSQCPLASLGEGAAFRFGWRGCVWQEGQTDEEGRACSLDGLEPDVPPMLLNEFATEVEPQACTADPVGLTIGRPHKTAKKVGLLCLRDADTLIADTDEGLLPLDLRAQGHLDRPSCWAVFDGVGEQIREHLLDASPIQVRQQGRVGGRERKAMAVGALLDLCDHAPAEGYQISWLKVQHQLSCLQTNHIEQILREPIQAIGGQVDLCERLLWPVRERHAFATGSLREQHL